MSFSTPVSVASKRVQFTRELTRSTTSTTTTTTKRPNVSLTTPRSVKATKHEVKGTNQSSSIERNLSLSANYKSSSENNLIKVGIRVRPTNEKELALGSKNIIRVDQEKNQIVLKDASNKQHEFECDFVITDQKAGNDDNDEMVDGSDRQQQYVYECAGKPLLDKAFDGYNVSIFAYGQTGSGKTYSMIGTDSCPGLIPRFFDDLFENKLKRDKLVSNSHIEISYYEIYNEKIFDLLRSTKEPVTTGKNSNLRNLQIREDKQKGPYIVGLQTLSINSAKDAKMWLDIGNKRRATAYTNMNDKSSRSHSVFQIRLTQMLEHKEEPLKPSSKHTNGQTDKSLLQLFTSQINLVDLAGSERNSTSFSGSAASSKYKPLDSPSQSRFKESTCINKSLLTLGKIICLLSERQSSTSTSVISNNNHLPYRDSVLTFLLKESLGGNAKTAMLATINSSSIFLDETMCTLRYAAKTAKIKNVACLNRDFKKKYIDEFGQECEMNLIMEPMTSMSGLSMIENDKEHLENTKRLELTLKKMDQEWKEKLEEAERLKQKEILELEKSLICLYEKETHATNCCLINLNEDPSLSEKLIYSIKDTCEPILIGSDKKLANIHLANIVLIAPIHCQITQLKNPETQLNDYFIEQVDDNADTKTFLNGERIEAHKQRPLQHGNCIVIGGSHYFRFHNPVSKKGTSGENQKFKDYQFAKEEIERCQVEEIRKANELKMQELQRTHQMDIQLMKNELEKEKQSRKLEFEQIKTESDKKFKQIVHKKMVSETLMQRKTAVESTLHQMEVAKQQIERAEEDDTFSENLSTNAMLQTPLAKTPKTSLATLNIVNQLTAEKTLIRKESIIRNKNSVFATRLHVAEANKACSLIGIQMEFKLIELPEKLVSNRSLDLTSASENGRLSIASSTSSSKSHGAYTEVLCVIDNSLSSSRATLWSLDKFEQRLSILRDIMEFFMDEKDSEAFSVDMIFKSADYLMFVESDSGEWQDHEELKMNEYKFTQNVIDNLLAQNDRDFKRDNDDLDTIDSRISTKRKCLDMNGLPPPTPLSSIKTSKTCDINPLAAPIDTLVDSSDSEYIHRLDLICQSSDSEDDFDPSDSECELENTGVDETSSSRGKRSNGRTKVPDIGLKLIANFVDILDKLVINLDSTIDIESMVNKCLDFDDEQALNSKRSERKQLMANVFLNLRIMQMRKDNTWSLINDAVVRVKARRVYAEIKNYFKMIKVSINQLFHVLSMGQGDEKRDTILEQLIDEIKTVVRLHGEHSFINSQIWNTNLNRTSSLLCTIDSSYLREYAEGVDETYGAFLQTQLAYFSQTLKFQNIHEFIEQIEKFRNTCERFKLSEAESIVDFCNYAFESHYYLVTAARILKKEEMQPGPVNSRVGEQVQILLAKILKSSDILNRSKSIKLKADAAAYSIDEMYTSYESLKRFFREQH